MAAELKPIRTKRDYEAALKEVERLWGAKAGTADGNRLDVLATLIEAYEAEHFPMDPPDPIEAIKFRWSSKASRGGTWRRSSAHAPALPRFLTEDADCRSP
jgi:antitoxin component HigA of HigAB toxin-antitoxin module